MIKNMILPLLLEINIKGNYFHISWTTYILCTEFLMKFLSNKCIPRWVAKKFQIYSVKVTEKYLSQSRIYYFYCWNNKNTISSQFLHQIPGFSTLSIKSIAASESEPIFRNSYLSPFSKYDMVQRTINVSTS